MTSSPEDRMMMSTRRLAKSHQELVQNFPYYTHLVSSWEIYASGAIATMGVTTADGLIKLFFNPAFVMRCSAEELLAVLHHEINHIMLGHLTMSPECFPDGQALMLAQEISANEWIKGSGEKLPKGVITLNGFPDLPPGESTEARYHRLAGKSGNQIHRCMILEPVIGQPAQSAPDSSDLVALDDHRLWLNPELSKLLEKMSTRISEPFHQYWASDFTGNAPLSNPAGLPGHRTESLFLGQPGKLNWRRLLATNHLASLKMQSVFTRPPRRFPHLAGIVPGRQHRPEHISVMTVIDTSGSMKQPALNAINGEIDLIAAYHDVTVVECDTSVQNVYRYKGKLTSVQGRGGTNFQPAFSPELLNRIKPEVVVYFTDGKGAAPDKPPPVPVIWCLTPYGEKPTTWGKSVVLPAVGTAYTIS